MVLVLRVGENPPQVRVTRRTAAVLRRAPTTAVHTAGGLVAPPEDLDGVLPAVAEVVEVLEPGRQVSQPRRGLVLDLEVGPVRVRHAVAHTVGHELVQMAVRPTECSLEQLVQFRERRRCRDVDHPDDGRLDVAHGDPQPGGPHARTVPPPPRRIRSVPKPYR